jgi:hypothetical protein
MYEQVAKTQENKSQSATKAFSQRQNSSDSTFQFVDNRPEAIQMQKLQELANNSPQVKQLRAFQSRAVANSVAQKKSNVKQGFGFVDNRPEAVAQWKLQDMTNNSPQVSQLRAFQETTYNNPQTIQNTELQNRLVSDNEVAQLAHYKSGDPVYMDDDDPTSKLLDDNFDATIKGKLTQPTADGTIKNAVTSGNHINAILWRSTTGASVAAIQAAGSAGGKAVQANVAAPDHAVQQNQIAVGGVVPEYTASRDVTGFSWRHWLVVVRINTRYLARGSAAESGWICNSAAPVVVLDTVDRTMGLPEPAGLGAA